MEPSRGTSPATTTPDRPLTIAPLYDFLDERIVRAGALVIAAGVVAPGPFWNLLQHLAERCVWLDATFALSSRPNCYGMARTDGARLVTSFCGTWSSEPRLTLIAAGTSVSQGALELAVRWCVGTTFHRDAHDPFPETQPGCTSRTAFFGRPE